MKSEFPVQENDTIVKTIQIRSNLNEVLERLETLKGALEKANAEITELASRGITLEIDV